MNRKDKLIIKTSPIVFLKRLIFIEFVMALASALFIYRLDTTELYSNLQIDQYLSYNLALGIIITVIQVVMVAIAFFLWYVDTYEIDRKVIIRYGTKFFGIRNLAYIQAITEVQITQSFLGDRFNYGTIELTLLNRPRTLRMPNIPDPYHRADQIRALIAPQQIEVNKLLEKPLELLVSEAEGQYTEFKSSFSWDYRRQSINKELNKAVMKNVVGFMNSTGGAVIIGVSDDGEILGLAQDFSNLRKQDPDGFENSFNMVFNKMVGVEYSNYIKLDFAHIEEKVICRVFALPTPEPVYLRNGNQEEFYIRTGNSSQPLTISQAVKYIQQHFQAEG